ncbi:MAG: IS200/IS605 family transposase [Gammaproteobacteria bacterium]
MYKWRTGRSCVFKNNVHLVFVTKYRRNVFTQEMLARMKELLDETCAQMEAELLEFGGEDDHVHMLVTIPPKVAVSILVGKLKGKSAYYLRKEFWPQIKDKLWGAHLWSPSYCVVSCGGATLNIVKEYVKNQRTPPTQRQIDQSQKISKVGGLA